MKESRFREDLFYRLNTITLRMPPLRKRKEDIPMLVDYFLKNSRFGGSAQQIKRIDPRVMEVFHNYDWPGNIRELQNTIERLKILAENNEIRLEDIPFSIRMPKSQDANRATSPSTCRSKRSRKATFCAPWPIITAIRPKPRKAWASRSRRFITSFIGMA